MNSHELFQKYAKRLTREGMLKALLCGLAVGCAVNFVVAFVLWFFPADGLWISLGAGVLALVASTPLFYLYLFRPTTKSIAERIDRLGLDERLITMTELEEDHSYIAMRQREDAQAELSKIDEKSIKRHVPRSVVLSACITGAFAIAMTTVSALVSFGVIDGGDVILNPEPEPKLFEVFYEIDGAGDVLDDSVQFVYEGDSAATVVAVAEEGWMFDSWSDGWQEPVRTDTDVKEDLTFTAIFVEIGEGDGQGKGDGEGDESDEEGDEQGEQNNDGYNQDGDHQDDGSEGSGGGTGQTDNNTIFDGETDYRTTDYDIASRDYLSEDSTLPPELREILQKYLDTIK